MALQFNSVSEKMYDIVIEGHKWSFNEEMTQRVINFMNDLQNGKASEPVATVVKTAPVKALASSDVKCKWTVEKVATEGGKAFYRISDGIFTLGKWRDSKYDDNKEYRIPTNLEAHRLAMTALKDIDGIKSVEMSGGWKAYGFTTKKACEKAIEKLPEMIQGVQIDGYIAKHGKIPAKAVTREKRA